MKINEDSCKKTEAKFEEKRGKLCENLKNWGKVRKDRGKIRQTEENLRKVMRKMRKVI